MENHRLEWIFPLKIVIFHSYVSHYQRVQVTSRTKTTLRQKLDAETPWPWADLVTLPGRERSERRPDTSAWEAEPGAASSSIFVKEHWDKYEAKQ